MRNKVRERRVFWKRGIEVKIRLETDARKTPVPKAIPKERKGIHLQGDHVADHAQRIDKVRW